MTNQYNQKFWRWAFAKASEIERDLINQRTKEALAAKKRAGMKLGRPKGSDTSKLDKHRPEIEALRKLTFH